MAQNELGDGLLALSIAGNEVGVGNRLRKGKMKKLVINVVNKGLRLASSLHIDLLASPTDFIQLFHVLRNCSLFAECRMFNYLSVLVSSDKSFNAYGIHPITITRVIPRFFFGLINVIAILREGDRLDHPNYFLHPVSRQAFLIQYPIGIIIICIVREVFAVIGIMEKTCENNVFLLFFLETINAAHSFPAMLDHDKGMGNPVGVVHFMQGEQVSQFVLTTIDHGAIFIIQANSNY